MKKLLLAALIPMSFCANAQQAKKAIEPYHIRNTVPNTTSAKSSIAGGRWYSHSQIVYWLFTNGLMADHVFPIWYDSSVLQNYTTGLAPIEFISAAQIIDPIHFTLWNDPNVSDPNIIAIEPESVYKVDSISFYGAYIKNPNRSVNVVDTLILSVSPTSADTPDLYKFYSTSATFEPWVVDYIPNIGPDTVLKGFTIDSVDIDVPNRASNVAGRVLWKVPLTDADRQQIVGDSIIVENFTYPVLVNGVPGVCNIPAGRGVVVTLTFKSGDTIIPNVDTFSEYHHLLLSSREALGDSTIMPYYFYEYKDRDMSNLMRYSNDSVYHPTVFLDGENGSFFGYEFHDIAAHVVCDDCPTVVGEPPYAPVFSKPITTIYPNPAHEFLTISFAQQQDEDVSVSIINAIGQVVSKKDIDKETINQAKKVTLSTSALPEGIYYYTITTNGQQSAGRFTVIH